MWTEYTVFTRIYDTPPFAQLSVLTQMCVQNVFNFVRYYKTTLRLSVDKLEKRLPAYWVHYGNL
jgi:hypothetical protein